MAAPQRRLSPVIERIMSSDAHVILWNDPVNTMQYVTRVLLTVCGHEPKMAMTLMMVAHTYGKVCVKTCPFTEAKTICDALHAAGLTATVDAHDRCD